MLRVIIHTSVLEIKQKCLILSVFKERGNEGLFHQGSQTATGSEDMEVVQGSFCQQSESFNADKYICATQCAHHRGLELLTLVEAMKTTPTDHIEYLTGIVERELRGMIELIEQPRCESCSKLRGSKE
jgi:hypothetical protein